MTVYLAQAGHWVALDDSGRVVGRGETREAAISKATRTPGPQRRRPGSGKASEAVHYARQKQRLATKVRVIGFYVTKSMTKGIR